MKKILHLRWRLGILALMVFLGAGVSAGRAATLYGTASIQAADTAGNFTSSNGTFTVACWFRMSIPSGVTLSDNMDILMDRSDGNESANFCYLVRFNATSGNVEFTTHGPSGSYTKTLIPQPYLERWYHVAVARSGNTFTCYVDGRQVGNSEASAVGNGAGSGLSIGGIGGSSKLFYGDIIEASFYNLPLADPSAIQSLMFSDQRGNGGSGLTGYFKLGYSTNSTDYYRNFGPGATDFAAKVGSGNIDFLQTDQAGEQSLFDSRKNHGDDALAALSGAFGWQQTALSRPVPGIAFDLRFGYSTVVPTTPGVDGSDPYSPRVLSPGWRNTFDTRVVVGENQNVFLLITWDGGIETWTRSNSAAQFQTRHREYRGELMVTNNDVEWTSPERLVYHFHDPTDTANPKLAGRLNYLRDFNNNLVQIQWDQNLINKVTNVVDTAGGNYPLKYNSFQLLTNISFGAWQVNFAYDGNNRLISKSITNTSGLYSPVNTTWQFAYNATSGLLERITDPRGNTNIFVTYDKYSRKVSQMDAIGRTTQTEYDVPTTRQMRNTDSGGFKWIEIYDTKGRATSQQDPLGNTTSYTYDDFGNRTSITEPLGYQTFFGYDSRANVIARTNALGEVSQWVFHPFFNKAVQEISPQPLDVNGSPTWVNNYSYDEHGNLTNHSDAIGSLVQYTYSTNGLVLRAVDANGNVSRMAYDTNGFLIALTDAATNTSSYAYNDVGWKLAETNALGQATTYTLNLNGNVLLVVDPLGRNFTRSYDDNGNVLTQSDAKNQLTRFAYDPANQKTNMVDRTGTNVWTFTFTSRGKPERIIDPLGNTVTSFYDSANRAVKASDPLGNYVTNLLDANGNITTTIDKLGQQWTKTYDRLGRVILETDPLGNTKKAAFDVAGRVLQTISPNGYPTDHRYDGRGRLIKWHDPEGYDWLYSYDGVANITNITDALGGHYLMAYGSRNERILEHNQDNFEWRYTYDELLRLKTQRDPNGTSRTLEYDAGGRALSVTFSTGRINSFAYDDNNNPEVLSRSGSGPATITQLHYDSLDRVTECVDAFGKRVDYSFDALGRITTLRYPDGKTLTNSYDALSRLTNQVDWAGRKMSYAYDVAGRLISRSYPNGVVQTNSFDNASRITGLSYFTSSNQPTTINIALAYAYDHNGNKTSSNEKGTLNWAMPTLADENARYTASGRLIDRSINNTVSNTLNTIAYNYDPSGNMTNAVMASGGTNAQFWKFTYDEDNRVTSVGWDAGITAKAIANRYDALGRRISKTVDGTENRYVLDISGNMERILCDFNSSGGITAYYIHGPDLCYKVDVSANLICYHADALGNIISLTGTGGTNLAQYAYTPYGRSLGSTNFQGSGFSSQLFTFVGSQGVMEELPGLYFMRARYYSADAGLFLSTDPVKHIGPGWKPTAYGYANCNPIYFSDPSGNYALWDDAIAIGGGALGGMAGRFVGDWITGHNSTWEDYVGSAVGGAVGAEVTLYLGPGAGAIAAGAAGGAVGGLIGNGLSQGLKIADASQKTGFDWTDLATDTIGGGLSGGLAGAIKIPGITSGRNSFASVENQITTKLGSGQIQSLSMNTLGKIGANEAANAGIGIATDLSTQRASSGLVNGAISAASHANVLNSVQTTVAAVYSQASSTTSKVVSATANAFTQVANNVSATVSKTVNQVTTAVKSVTTTVTTAVSKAVSTVSSWVSSAWSFVSSGGKKK